MRWYRVVLKPKVVKAARADRQLLIALHVAQMVSAMRSTMRLYVGVQADSGLTETADRLHVFLFHASTLYEAIQAVKKILPELRKLPNWDAAEFQKITRGYSSKLVTILNKIRNRVFYHFKTEWIQEELEDGIEDPTFGQGADKTKGTFLYTMPTDLLLKRLFKRIIPGTKPVSDSLSALVSDIMELTKRFCTFAEGTVLKDLLDGKVDYLYDEM